MKVPSEKEIEDLVTEIIESVENDWGKFGDLSDWTRKELVNKLRKVRRMLRFKVRRVDIKLKSNSAVKTK